MAGGFTATVPTPARRTWRRCGAAAELTGSSSRHPTQRPLREAITAGQADHLWRQALLELADYARRSVNTGSDFGKELRGSARTERVQMLVAALQTEPVERIEMDHDGDLSGPSRLHRRAEAVNSRGAATRINDLPLPP
jgi:hypothetical protein